MGSESYPERETAEAILRQVRPLSDAPLVAAARSPNPEISVRARRALTGIPPIGFTYWNKKFEYGYNFLYNSAVQPIDY